MKTANYLINRNNRIAWLILSPFLLYFLVFYAYPTVFALVLGFVDWIGVNTTPRFAGFANFVSFFSQKSYLDALMNTFFIGGLLMIINVFFGLFGAFFINMQIRGKTFFRTLWYLPSVTASIAITQVFALFINPFSGIANNIVTSMGGKAVAWATSYGWMVFWIVLYGAWRGIGAAMILWLAGLQSIDRELYEQAEIDGAHKGQVLRRITLPLLRPITVYVLITQFIAAVQIFEPVMFISRGQPFGTTNVITSRVFLDFYGDLNFGIAGAGAMVMTLIVAIFSVFTLRWYKVSGGSNA